ncbi:MAG: hypothetical protein HKN42_16610, partial [Granulosicoccus sp.]|nr:hypothetical protein [Granulosicoccus sp.]
LTSHEDAAVRSISLSILSRWSTDGRDTPVLLDALQDTEQGVRQSAAYALVGHEVVNQSVIDSLWAVAVDDGDTKATRSAAVLALRGMQLSDAQRRDLAAVQRELATVARRQ